MRPALQTVTVGGFAPAMLALVFAVVFLGGLVKGTAGFGYAIVGTAVLATVLVGIAGLCLVAAWGLGLFATGSGSATGLLALSAVAAVPGLVGVAAGQRLRRRLPERYVTVGAVLLLAVIGVKHLSDGLAGL